MNVEIKEILDWFKVNKLSLNVKKTHIMFFTKRTQLSLSLSIKVDGAAVDTVTKTFWRDCAT